MWWRFLTFCVLVCFVLFVVLSCIHGRPVIHLLFRRCCEDDIENDQVILEDFGNNYLRERLVGAEFVVDVNDSFVSDLEVQDMIKAMRSKVNVHDPTSRTELKVPPNGMPLHKDAASSSNETSTEIEANKEVKELFNELLDLAFENVTNADLLLESKETIDESKVTSAIEIITELDSDENNSIEATTENSNNGGKNYLGLPLRIREKKRHSVDVSKESLSIEDKSETALSEEVNSTSVIGLPEVM